MKETIAKGGIEESRLTVLHNFIEKIIKITPYKPMKNMYCTSAESVLKKELKPL